ncbi:MAG: hypothetical protein ACLQVX_11175 [Limisphaerales bacterium]
MDAAGLSILLAELEADCFVLADAGRKAGLRLREQNPGHLEACAYELARLYNVLEKMLERICEAFENHFEKRGDYHEKLIQRLNLRLEGIRPAFIPAGRADDVRELKGIRHVVRHAYDLTLRPDRLSELVSVAERLAAELPAWCAGFASAVRAEQHWPPR